MELNSASLSTLRVFETAARHLSFTDAAAELNITQSAVSKQIKRLEEQLDIVLFHRLVRSLELTREGAKLAEAVRKGIDLIDEAILSINSSKGAQDFYVTAHPGFLNKWLIPKLNDYYDKFPEINLYIDASSEAADLTKREFELAIHYSEAPGPTLTNTHLMDEYLLPVCSPDLSPFPTSLYDLGEHCVLHDRAHTKWRNFLTAMNIPWTEPKKEFTFSSDDIAIQAAIAGQGIIITRLRLIEQDIKKGLLVPILDHRSKSDKTYWALTVPDNFEKPHVQDFIKWIKEKVEIE